MTATMKLIRIKRGVTHQLGQIVHPLWPGRTHDCVFVVGCPRSGTTAFGRLLGQHPRILYLNEPRYIWRRIDPMLNIWRGHETQGRLYWSPEQASLRTARLISQWFDFALTVHRRQRLVEKTPLNVFRIRWLGAMFPQAKFIHLVRHGRDAALSLEEAVTRWFSAGRGYREGYWAASWHYTMFEDFARSTPDLADLPDRVHRKGTNYARTLLVWVCSVWVGLEASRYLSPTRLLRIDYEALVCDPADQLSRVLDFIGEPLDNRTLSAARKLMHDKSLQKRDPDPDATKDIAGAMLEQLGYR